MDGSITAGFDGVVNDYFLVETEHFVARGLWPHEVLLEEGLDGFAWWTLAEIENAKPTEVFGPRNLAELFPTMTQRHHADEPLRIGP